MNFQIETEFSHGNMQRKHGLLVKVLYHEHNPSGIDVANGRAENVPERKRIVAASSDFRLLGKNNSFSETVVQ